MKGTIRVLIIEDNLDDVILEVQELKAGGFEVVYDQVENAGDMKEALMEKTWDCIFSDYSMPQFSGLDALTELKKSGLDIPFILISGAIGEEIAVAAMKAGAHDYIMKNNLNRLVPALERELRESQIRSQKRKAEATIRYERILLRTLIDNLPDLIYIKDKEGRKIVSNVADVEFMGFTSEAEVIGKTDQEIFGGEIGSKRFSDDQKIIQTGKSELNFEEEYTDSKGKNHWMLTSKIPIYNENGEISGIVGMCKDITHRKKTEIALKESEKSLLTQNAKYYKLNKEYIDLNEKLMESLNSIQSMNEELIISKEKAEESDKLKSAFLANMSHEVRTPLNAILGFSGFFRDPELSRDKIEKYIEIIESSGHQLLTIIDDILDISKIEAGQITVFPEEVNVGKLMQELLLQYTKQVESKNLELLLKPNDESKEIVIKTDKSRLRQVICNLLNNAIKFTLKGKIEFGYTLNDQKISFYVSDTGIGIAPEDQSGIFEPFRQVENTYTRNFGGNGLGLSISRELVKILGGRISLQSELNKGSVFTFTLPVIIENSLQPKTENPHLPGNNKNWQKHLILVVEDEPFNFSYIEEILSHTNVKVLHAWDGLEAIKLVEQHPDISLVLMDIKMPVMDGYAATQHIKELRPELPVIAQSAYAINREKESELKIEFDNYILKPVKNDLFIEVISNYLVAP